jgi:hypothetical protein
VVILVELLTITQWVELRGDLWWYSNINKNHPSIQLIEWWSTIPPISTKITFCLNSLGDIGGIVDHHSMSWTERWFVVILVELLTITQWVEVRGDLWLYWWNCWPSLNVTHWVIVNNSTNINNNHLSPQLIKWWSTIPPISTKISSHLITLSDGQQYGKRWFLLILVKLLTITQWVKVRGDFCWYWWNYWPSLNELNIEGWFLLSHWVMVNNSTNINKNHLSP